MCNGGIECSLKYLLITCFTRHCHKFTLPSFIVLTADTVDTVQMVSWVWLGTRRCQWTYASNLHVLVQTIFMFENSFWTASCANPYLSSTERWEPVSASKVSCFVLCEADIYIKPSTMGRLSGHLNSLAQKFCSFRSIF